VALSELYKWTTTGLAACFPSFMACLLARQEGSKRKPTKDDRYRQLNMARNCPREQLVLTREADPIFFDAVKNKHFLCNGSLNKLHPEVMAKFVPFLQKQAKLTRKRTKSLDSANWTGSLGALSELYKWTTTGLAACFPSFIFRASRCSEKRKPEVRRLHQVRLCGLRLREPR
jgi:hypothetical protein